MATKIEYLDETWNPVTGCSPVSEGCTHCWAKIMAHRFPAIHGYYQEFDGDYHGWEPAEFKHVRFHPERLGQPLKWKKPRRIGVCFMGDLFHKDISREWITLTMSVISGCPGHTFMVLTKRPENALQYFRSIDCYWGMKNIWLGVTAENQQRADERIPILLQIPAAKHFVSLEPLLGPVEIKQRLDLVIVGGETGPGARPMNPDWARSIRDQCKAAGVPFFFKKMGGNRPTPPDLMIREFPK